MSLLNYFPRVLSCSTCSRASRASYLTCFCALGVLCPMCSRPSSASCLTWSSPLCILLTQMPHESHSLHFLCTSYSCHTCSLAPYHSLASGVSSLTYTYPSHILYVSCLVALLSLALELFETFTEWLRLIVVICYF